MTGAIEKCAFDDVHERQLFMVNVAAPQSIPRNLDLGSPNFGCFIAWDASHSTTAEVVSLIEPLIEAGCVYFCCWGPSCERVHDIIDESDPYTDGVIMTTWHDSEPLEEALWFFLNVTWPDAKFENSFHASIAVTIGSEEWASLVRSALGDPRRFSSDVLAKEEVNKAHL